MTYPRVVLRNGLQGSYAGTPGMDDWRRMIAGDMRRLETDMLDDHHIAKFCDVSGATSGEVRAILRAFFSDFGVAIVPWLGADPHGRDLVEAATATVCNRREPHDPHVLSVANVCLGLRLSPMPAKDPE